MEEVVAKVVEGGCVTDEVVGGEYGGSVLLDLLVGDPVGVVVVEREVGRGFVVGRDTEEELDRELDEDCERELDEDCEKELEELEDDIDDETVEDETVDDSVVDEEVSAGGGGSSAGQMSAIEERETWEWNTLSRMKFWEEVQRKNREERPRLTLCNTTMSTILPMEGK